MKKFRFSALVLAWILCLATCLSACGSGSSGGSSSADSGASGFTADYGGKVTLRIISGSENRELESVLDDFAKKEKINIEMDYRGSLDIMRTLQADTIDYDAVWPANSMWITAGDTKHRVKDIESISLSPIIFGIRRSLAEELGFVGKDVYVRDILKAIQDGKLKFCMTSATQSNSGCCAYIGFLNALLGNPDAITSEDLDDETLQTQMADLFSGVERSSGSSEWLKDMFLSGSYDAMVNYECLIISANQELEKENKETLYAVYPVDALTCADSPLGYVDQGDGDKEDAFLKLQDYLLSDEVQDEIQKTGRRARYNKVSDANSDIFNSDWGISTDNNLSSIKMPESDVLFKALDLYQSVLRKPSLTAYCLDYSGSMYGEGNEQLVAAMQQILIQKDAEEDYLQAGPEDVNILIPFDGSPRDVHVADGNGSELEGLYDVVKNEGPDGGTDIYSAAARAMDELKNYDLSQYTTAIVLMTDGMSDGSYSSFEEAYESSGMDVPIFSIMFGDADSSQLDKLAELSNARVFDGRKDLESAFRAVKGYN